MSWDAHLIIDGVDWGGRDWNYTHNTSGMIYDALERAGVDLGFVEGETCLTLEPVTGVWVRGPLSKAWWKHLNGMSGAEGCRYLTVIVEQLEKDPDHYRKMNPENDWGNYDGILKTLTEMRDACTSEIPMTWEASG